MNTNEAFIALPDGDVIRTGAICRIRPDQRWDAKRLRSVKGTPSKQATRPDDTYIEAVANPHVYVDDTQRSKLDMDEPNTQDTHQPSAKYSPS